MSERKNIISIRRIKRKINPVACLFQVRPEFGLEHERSHFCAFACAYILTRIRLCFQSNDAAIYRCLLPSRIDFCKPHAKDTDLNHRACKLRTS